MAERISFLEYCSTKYTDLGPDITAFDVEQTKLDYERDCPVLKTAVFVDDQRLPVAQIPGYGNWMLCRSFEEWVTYLSFNGPPDLVSLDHDLAQEHYDDFTKYELEGIASIQYGDFKQHTGLQCAEYYAAFCAQNGLEMKMVTVHCPERAMGAHNIQRAVNAYKRSQGQVEDCFIASVATTTLRELQQPRLVS